MNTTPLMIDLKWRENPHSHVLSEITELSILDPTRKKCERILQIVKIGEELTFKAAWDRVTTWINSKHGDRTGLIWIGHHLYGKARDILGAAWVKHDIDLPESRKEMCDSDRIVNCVRRGKDNELKDFNCMLGLPQNPLDDTAQNVNTIWCMLRRFARDRNPAGTKEELIHHLGDRKWASKIADGLKIDPKLHFVVYDFETNGLPVDGVYPQAVQLSAYAPENPAENQWFDSLITLPERVPFNQEAADFSHKIKPEQLVGKPTFGEAYRVFRRFITPERLGDKIVMIGYNNNGFQKRRKETFPDGRVVTHKYPGGFDVNVLMDEAERFGFNLKKSFTTSDNKERIHYCAMKQFDVMRLMLCCFAGQFKKGEKPYKFYSLVNMTKFFDLPFEGAAHNAKWDVLATWRLFERIVGNADWNRIRKAIEGKRTLTDIRTLAFSANPALPGFISGKVKAIIQPSIPQLLPPPAKEKEEVFEEARPLDAFFTLAKAVDDTEQKEEFIGKVEELSDDEDADEILEGMNEETRGFLEELEQQNDPSWAPKKSRKRSSSETVIQSRPKRQRTRRS